MRKVTTTILIILVLGLFISLQLPANLHAQTDGCPVLWNKLGSKTEVENSEVGPDIQLRSYIYSHWQEAQIVPAQFGNGLFINHDTNEGLSNDGANFFAVDLEGTNLTTYRGAIEFWFKFKYDSSFHNHAYFITESIVLTDHYLPGQMVRENAVLYAGWNGWDYGSEGKRFFFGINHPPYHLSEVTALTPDYSAAPGGHLEFSDGTIAHFAFVWDVEGIENTQETIRIYVNGNKEASATGKWVTDYGLDRYLYLGTIPNHGPHDHNYNAVKGVTDNIIIWDYARTDFSHRFYEAPPIPAECLQPPPLCDGQEPTILGTEDHDVIEGTPGPDVIHGLGGHDFIEGKGGGDVICGGNGNDTIIGHGGNDIILGGAGNDTLLGSAGNDILKGGNGVDYLAGNAGNDKLRGNGSNDTLNGGPGSDDLWGGGGNDTCYDDEWIIFTRCEVNPTN